MADHRKILMQLTSLPTAAGREDRVIEWVHRWARRRNRVRLEPDRFGNLLLRRAASRSRRPVIFSAHMDHPAFVVTRVGGDRLEADFRGGVPDDCFPGSAVQLHHGDRPPQRGTIVSLKPAESAGQDKRVLVRFGDPVEATPGDLMTWDLEPAYVRHGRLYAPACDDLAAVAAALAAFDLLGRVGGGGKRRRPDVRVLLTRAEEVGLIGAIAACRSGIIPAQARIIVLENSRSSAADSPIGAGPIVRVGDLASTFDPDLTYRVGRVAQAMAARDSTFKWQRKLMPGGTCEASAYAALGFASTCLCLPLGNYHNVNEAAAGRGSRSRSGGQSGGGAIGAEMISLSDYHGLIRLLVEVGRALDQPAGTPSLRDALTAHFAQRRRILD